MTSVRQRKPHSKSRAGCLPCKKRHIKCGEERPSCQNCIDREDECIYGLAATSRLPPNSRAGSGTHSDHASCNLQDARKPPCTSDSPEFANHNVITRMEELQLLFYYMNATAETMSTGSDVDVWTKVVPEEASQHDFLMDGLLALSALHFAFNNPTVRWRYVDYASRYQASALRKYTQALQSFTESNGHALFAHAIVTMILALAFTTMHRDATNVTPIDDLTSLCRLLRGIGLVSQASGTTLEEGPFQAFHTSEPAEDRRAQLQPDVANAMKELVQQTKKTMGRERSDCLQVYLSSIDRLEFAFQRLETSHNLRYIMAWPAMVDKELLDYLQNGDSIAQLIFLHYGVLLLRAHDRWWGRGFGLRLIEHLAASLCTFDAGFTSLTEWARTCAATIVDAS